jgi:glyoxylase-like metal-dependent hydrolase (beta-lactamase superfamily II)
MSVRTPNRAGTEALLRKSPVPALPRLHQVVLPSPLPLGSVQIHVVESGPLTLIDAGLDTPESFSALESVLDEIGAAVEDIQRVVLTHYHRDHMGLVQTLRDRGANLEVWAHVEDAPMIESFSLERCTRIDASGELLCEYGTPRSLVDRQAEQLRAWLRNEPPRCRPTRVDQLVRGGERIPFKDFELEVIHAPGHTPGHILLHEPESGALLTGDHLMIGTIPTIDTYYLDGPPDPSDPLGRRPRFCGLPAFLRTTRELRSRRFSHLLSAQGVALSAPERIIRDAILYYDVRVQQIERGLRRLDAMGQDVTGYELWQALFPSLDPITEMRPRMPMVIGALDILEAAGTCRTHRREDGVLLHRYT